MTILEKYSELQRTTWKEFATTTIGHLPKEQYAKIEPAYAELVKSPSETSVPSSSGNNDTGPQQIPDNSSEQADRKAEPNVSENVEAIQETNPVDEAESGDQ